MDVTTQLLSKAHAEFRKLRSGELGDNLRAQGINYKIIWGLESYRLKGIAEGLKEEISGIQATVNEQRDIATALAVSLWKEDVRESKMLATRLYPVSDMDIETALAWAADVRYTELADQLCMNLLSRLGDAPALAAQWIEETELKQYMALQLILRLNLTDFHDKVQTIARNESKPLWLRATADRVLREE